MGGEKTKQDRRKKKVNQRVYEKVGEKKSNPVKKKTTKE